MSSKKDKIISFKNLRIDDWIIIEWGSSVYGTKRTQVLGKNEFDELVVLRPREDEGWLVKKWNSTIKEFKIPRRHYNKYGWIIHNGGFPILKIPSYKYK